MNLAEFSYHVEEMRQRLQVLQWQVDSATQSTPTVEHIVQELFVALEELRVAQEEWQQQNEEFLVSRREVEAERQRYRELFDFAPDGYIVTDLHGIISEANHAAAAQIQARQDFLHGKPLSVYIEQEDQPLLWQQLVSVQQGQEPTKKMEMRIRPRRGASFPAALTIAGIQGPQDNIVGLRWSIRDISARKQAESALREAIDQTEQRVLERTAELAHSNTMLRAEIVRREQMEEDLQQAKEAAEAANHTKAEFVAAMSHELRTPLAAILGYAELLEDSGYGALTKEQTDVLHRIGERCGELNNHITAVLDVSRLDAGRLPITISPVHIHNLLADVEKEMYEIHPSSGLTYVWQSEEDLPLVYTDANKLKTVLTNLVDNAFKFTDQGTITITAHARESGVKVSVADTGVGIAESARAKIFEPFCQGTHKQGGVGLGLYIVKRFVQMIGGRITLESEVGSGSTFRVWVPLAISGSSQPEGESKMGDS